MDSIEPVALGLSRSMSLRKHMSAKEDGAAERRHDAFFVCSLCKKVLMEPMECNKCDTPFCADCLETWKKDHDRCPGKDSCANPEYIPMHRFVKNLLAEHRFFCPMEGCEFHKAKQMEAIRQADGRVNFANLGMSFHEAVKHQQQCEYRMRPCPRGCGERMLGKDLAAHLPNCLNLQEKCEKCGAVLFPNRDKRDGIVHDCFDALVQATLETEKQLKEVKYQNGLDYDVVNPKCPKGKSLVVHRGLVLSYVATHGSGSTPRCDKCKCADLNHHEFFYRCSEWSTCGCCYDLCRMCALITCDPPVLAEKQKFVWYDKAELTRHSPNFEGWSCDRHKLPGGKSCESGLTESRYSRYV